MYVIDINYTLYINNYYKGKKMKSTHISKSIDAFANRMIELINEMKKLTQTEEGYDAKKFSEIHEEYMLGCQFIVHAYDVAKADIEIAKTFSKDKQTNS